jgi:hypothetical protein
MLEQIWNQQTLEGAQVEVKLDNEFAQLVNGRLILVSDSKAIGDYDGSDGRMVYEAAEVTLSDGTSILFLYREKNWMGLELLIRKRGEKFVSSPPFKEELPGWAIQEQE